MNGLLLLLLLQLYCIEIMVAPVCGANTSTDAAAVMSNVTLQGPNNASPAFQSTSATHPTSAASTMFEISQSRTTVSQRPPTDPQPTTPKMIFYLKECLPVLMVTGGLIIACTILLVSTFLLTWKVCQLSKQIKALGSSGDLISTSEYWIGTAKKNKSKSETEAKETSILMDDMSQMQEEMGNGTTEEGGKLNEDGQTGEEKKTEDGNTGNNEEASSTPVTAAGSSSSSRPQEDATDSQATKAVAAASSGGKDEPKDVV
ncbi:uncharacterized protein [Pempheris klunzingeri]|uniref:uncharacterized protein n=1 Tax=Pempheris klunzingeri TaxID=3127111 RepID=UPI003981277E